jgi:ADP-heptose:LPS heptosyltransferase
VCFGLNIGTKQPANRWLAQSWAKLIKKIKEKYTTKIILFGSQEDVVYKEEILSYLNKNEDVIDSVGKLNIKQLCLLIKRCNIFTSHDSGPAHLSINLGVPTVVLFGKSDPHKWGYLENKNYSVIQKPVACRPCGKIECEDNICMKLINVEDVLKSIEELINKNYGKIKN